MLKILSFGYYIYKQIFMCVCVYICIYIYIQCRASFLMTFVQSGMPHRLRAHGQCMLSHDITT